MTQRVLWGDEDCQHYSSGCEVVCTWESGHRWGKVGKGWVESLVSSLTTVSAWTDAPESNNEFKTLKMEAMSGKQVPPWVRSGAKL